MTRILEEFNVEEQVFAIFVNVMKYDRFGSNHPQESLHDVGIEEQAIRFLEKFENLK